jgi:translation initiation factor IF-1
MALDRYANTAVVPWETASAGQATTCAQGGSCSARYRYQGAAGAFDIAVQYFDESDGISTFSLVIGEKPIDTWRADAQLGNPNANGHTSTRRTVRSIRLSPGDEIRVDVTPAGTESGALDYIEITPSGP